MRVLKYIKVTTVCLLLMLFLAPTSKAQTDINSAYSLFLYNFAKYSQWPAGGSGDFKITVLGNSRVYDELKKISASKEINGKKIVVEKVSNITSFDGTNLLFIANDQSSKMDGVRKSTTGKPILVVAEGMGMFKKGACISFYVGTDNKLKFQINDQELSSRNLKMAQSLKNMAFKG